MAESKTEGGLRILLDVLTQPRFRPHLVVAGLSFGLGWVPVLAGPSYELALATGILLPSVVAAFAARRATRQSAAIGDGPKVVLLALRLGCELAFLSFLVALLHGLRVGLCDLWRDAGVFALGPALGIMNASLFGTVVGEGLSSRSSGHTSRRRITLVALTGPLATIVMHVLWYLWTPTIFAFDPYVGYFSGALYDTVLADGPLLSYRLGTLATWVAAIGVAHALHRDDDGFLRRTAWPRGHLALALAAAVTSIVLVVRGPKLGHWQTASTISAELGGRVERGACHVIHDRRLDPKDVALFADDCAAHAAAVGTWLGLATIEPVNVYLFRYAADKRRLMGAAHTSVAKPWRREIYVQSSAYPHRVVGHELVHAIASAIARGPFKVAGSMGGLVPNPGLIEGIAEAGARRDHDLTLEQWGAAMRRIDALPPLDRVFGLGFYGSNSSVSYTAAGSFVAFVRDRYGAETLRRWHQGEDLPTLAGAPMAKLEASWHRRLDTVDLTDAMLVRARARFERPGVFQRRCPHVVDEQIRQGDQSLSERDYAEARRLYRGVLALDPGNVGAQFRMADCERRLGSQANADERLNYLATDDRWLTSVRLDARERQADLLLRSKKIDEALDELQKVLALSHRESRRRRLALKVHYATSPVAREALVALLIGTNIAGPDNIEAIDRIAEWRADDDTDGVPHYLLARQHLNRDRFDLAAVALAKADERQIKLPTVRREVARLQAVAACALRRPADAAKALERFEAEGAPAARLQYLKRMVARCTTFPAAAVP